MIEGLQILTSVLKRSREVKAAWSCILETAPRL
jgi:hypothetical protein